MHSVSRPRVSTAVGGGMLCTYLQWFKYTVTRADGLCSVRTQRRGHLAWTNAPPTLVFKSEVGFIGSIEKDSVVEMGADSDSKLRFLVEICFQNKPLAHHWAFPSL